LYEYLESLEGKIRDGIFFCVNKSDNFSVYGPVGGTEKKSANYEQLFRAFF
jgi:hypothetical protein